MILYLVQGLVLGLPAAAQPGPFQAYLLSQTMKNGWRRTLPAALAPLLSDGPIILLTILLLTQLPDWFLRGVQTVGGVFLLYLAWQAYRSVAALDLDQDGPGTDAPQQSVMEAALMNLLNPNPYLFWAFAAGPVLLQAWRSSVAQGLSFLLGFYGMLIGGFAVVIVLFATVGRLGPSVRRGMIMLSAVALTLFGLYQLLQGLFPGALFLAA
jgi:threonine/homoserine/homoserine lactone efflux protein